MCQSCLTLTGRAGMMAPHKVGLIFLGFLGDCAV
jgi:hypothetical protein